MQDMLQYFIDNPYITVIIAIVVFILTLVFVVKRIFSFVLTLFFLMICILSAYVIIYPESATNFLKGYTEQGYQNEDSSQTLNERAKGAYDTVRGKVEEYTEKLN